ncbi:hypothetical protein BJX68DRAFT_267119 [Aspergillus pseudodeflectus]|uniref:HNH nuclease domain-containing protein n=1 Tax=Aspergillus pseudodeflectus TaxID=176178 RepID=A0ABR4KD90_9EURO
MGPYDDEVNDQRRVELIDRIASHVPKGEKVEPGFWAFVWLSNIKKLEVFDMSLPAFTPTSRRSHFETTWCSKAVKTWAARDRENSPAAEEPTGQPTVPDVEVVGQSSDACRVTQAGDCIEVCHIHGLWGNGRFALKPISLSTDSKTLTVEFYWLHECPYEYRFLGTSPSSPASVDSTRRGTRHLDCQARRIVESGDRLTFTTEDPDTLPLPSMEILELQWILNRLVSLSGAADVPDEELDPDEPLGLAPPISAQYDEDII